jgi:hypothetical protein
MESTNEESADEVTRKRTEMREKFLRLMTALTGESSVLVFVGMLIFIYVICVELGRFCSRLLVS